MRKHQLLSILFMAMACSLPFMAQAQSDHQVTGTVTEVETEESMPGVNITVKGNPQRGTSTDTEGQYEITVPSEQDTLVFSFIGYVEREIPINGRETINVEMGRDVEALEDVVVIGYGEQEQDDNTGSVTAINSSDFNEGAITSPEELFQGKAAGVNVTSNDGAPGSGATIRIRGGSSLAASNDPLYVVDGVPLEGGGVSGMRNPLNTINPNDIESINILKDASATAIYGSRASNGVVIITTKKGAAGQDFSVGYNGRYSYQTNRDRVDVFPADQFRQIIEEQFGDNGTQYLGEANTNWQDQIYRNAFSQDHNINFTGSYGSLPYRASIGFSGNEGILQTDQNNRFTGSLSLTPTLLDDHLQVDFNIKGVRVDNQFANQGAIGNAVIFDPTQPVRPGEDNDPYAGYYTWTDVSGNPVSIAPDNPVALINQTDDQSTVYRSIGNLQLDYTLPFASAITATVNMGYDYSDVTDGQYLVPENAAFEYDGTAAGGVRSNYDQRKENELLDVYLNYNRELSSIESTIDFTGGYSWEHHYESGSEYATNFNRSDTLVVDQDTDYATEHYLVSFFGRLNYNFKDRYMLTATLRQDGTSRFSEDNRWGLFPSAAIAWKINEEPFLEGLEQLTQLKLRLGYGVTGQQRINQGDYPYLASYTSSEPNARYQFGDEFVSTLRPEGYNADLRWEETTTYNIGLDYGFLNDRLVGSIEAYYRETSDLLNVIPVAAGSNFTNRVLSNVGTLEVRGVEFNVTGRLVSNEDTYWELGFNATHSADEITQLTTVDDPNYIGVETGGIAGGTGNTIQIHSVGYPRNSFFVYEQVYDENGVPLEGVYVDRNEDGVINESDKYRLESPSPDMTLGISSRVEHLNWDFSFSGRANFGNYVYNNVNSGNAFYSDMLYNQYVRNAPMSLLETNFYEDQFHSDHYVENASFFRMDNITLGYSIPDLMNTISSVRISATVQNAFVISEYSGLDPEVFSGIDNNFYPRPRTFVLGLNLNF